MPGNWHVRFGERRAETSRREAVWRCAPTLPLSFLGPRPSRPRWLSLTGGDRTVHPKGRNAVEDGQGEAFLAREEWARSGQGKKAENGRCGLEIETERSDDGLRLDMPNRGRSGRVRPNDEGTLSDRRSYRTATGGHADKIDSHARRKVSPVR